MSSLPALEARRGQLIDEISTAEALKQSAIRAKFSARQKLDFGGNQISAERRTQLQAEISQAQAQIDTQTASLSTLNAQLAEVNAQIAELQAAATLPNQSTGETVQDDQAARAEGALTTNPPGAPQVDANGRIITSKTPTPTNASKFAPNPDTGINAATRRATDLQSTPAVTADPGPAPPANQGPIAGQTTGAAANNDDGSNGVRSTLNRLFGGGQSFIVDQPNILDQYASYTYNFSLYLITKEQYENIIRTKKKNIAGWALLMQSGGAPAGSGATTDVTALQYENFDAAAAAQKQLNSEGRNQFFSLDYYIDDVKFNSLPPGKGSGTAVAVNKLEFKIYESNGITLLKNLYKATQQFITAKSTSKQSTPQPENYASQTYLLVIRFYGYDAQGNLVKAGKVGADGNSSDSNAIVEKYIPFTFQNIKFRIMNKVVEYSCTAAVPAVEIGQGIRGVIPYPCEIPAKTLKDLLSGNKSATGPGTGNTEGRTRPESQTTTPGARVSDLYTDPAGTSDGAAIIDAVPGSARLVDRNPSASVSGGFDALGNYTGADIIAANQLPVTAGTGPTQGKAPANAKTAPKPQIFNGIMEAMNAWQEKLVKDGVFDVADEYNMIFTDPILEQAKITPAGQKGGRQQTTMGNPNDPKSKLSATQKVATDTKTTSVTAGMSLIQFIDQYTRTSSYITSQQNMIPETDAEGNTKYIMQVARPGQVLAWYKIGVQAVAKQYDYKRNDYAYKITYQLSPYKINDLQSEFFPTPLYQGVHKKYNYWFTGQNIAIRKFDQEFNYIYYQTVNGPQQNAKANAGTTTNYREYIKKAYQTRSNESSQGTRGQDNDPSANGADYLYSPADQSRVKIEIVGDPAWISQGETWSGCAGLQFRYDAFLADGTINYDAQEPLFQILFNTPEDYDPWTGLADAGANNYGADRANGVPGEANLVYTYKMINCTNTFSKGQFYQELVGVIVHYDLPDNNAKDTKREKNNQAANAQKSTAARNPALGYTDPMGTDDGAAIMAVAGTAPKWKSPLNNVGEITYDEMGNPISTPTSSPVVNQAPTSSGQPVGPAATPTTGTGNATGTNVGQPVQVNVYLSNGQVSQATSQAEINALYQNKQISAQEASSATNRLRIWQNAANSPTTAARTPSTVKDA